MKMFGPKSVSYYLFYISRLAAIGIMLLLSYILISLMLGNFDIINNQFQIAVPLMPDLYIKGFYEKNILITITLAMLFFTLFFYMLSNILKTFKANKLFTSKAIKQLNYFALLNLVVSPLVYFIIHFVIMNKTSFSDVYNVLLSLLLGVFMLFIVAVFKQGYDVQQENDLTI